MTISGTLYNRMMRDAAHCWFLHDATYQESLHKFLGTSYHHETLRIFKRLLQTQYSMSDVRVSARELRDPRGLGF